MTGVIVLVAFFGVLLGGAVLAMWRQDQRKKRSGRGDGRGGAA